MAYFLDSGILLRAVHRGDPRYPEVRAAVRGLLGRKIPVLTGLQHLAEFWNVTTRPPGERGGFNLPLSEAARKLDQICRGVKIITEMPGTPDTWKTLVQKHGVKGVQVHDARTAALMLTHSLTNLLTLNKADFVRYQIEGIAAVTPAELLASGAFVV